MNLLLGPGRVYLVVGPSGAGKDALINGARAVLRDDPRYVFVQRVVTRPAGDGEDHDSLDPASFAEAASRRAFALTWEAHGLSYGVPRAVDEAVESGRRIVCNVSRTAIARARRRWADVCVVWIEAPADVRAKRLRLRGRETDVESRIKRAVEATSKKGDIEIDNGGDLDAALAAFLRAIS